MNCFQVAMLASGSKGNAALIKAAGQMFLIDMGLSCRELVKRLQKLNIEPKQLQAIFITHEHSDHIKGLATFTKKYSVPIYSSEKTWRAIFAKENGIIRSACHIIDTNITYNGVKISSFEIPHDASDPHGYMFEDLQSGEKCTYLTDTGFITDTVRAAVSNADLLILEANHDIEMLKQGRYPQLLKQRILSTRGHLSNESAGWLLANMEKKPRTVFLAHLSEENNRPRIALETVKGILEHSDGGKNISFLVAAQNEIVTDFGPVQKNLFIE